MDQRLQQTVDFLRAHQHGVLSTVSPDGMPESAAIEYAVTDRLEIIFDTFNTYRKYKNIKLAPHVSFVVFDENATVQYEGKAYEIEGDAILTFRRILYEQVPNAQKFAEQPETRFFKITPEWIRFRDYSVNSEPLFELNL